MLSGAFPAWEGSTFLEVCAMIRNLNQLNFRPFGTISKTQRDLVPETLTRRTVHLTQGDMPVYRSGGDCWLAAAAA